jgi:tetratricopeptide (TPR) repeat protein
VVRRLGIIGPCVVAASFVPLPVAIFMGVGAAPPALAADRSISGCFSKSRDSSELRIIAGRQACRAGERTISWNRQGIAGTKGAGGERGERGERGEPGMPGGTKSTGQRTVSSTIEDVAKVAASLFGALVAFVLGSAILSLLALQFLLRIRPIRDRWWILREIRRPSLVVETLDDSGLASRIGQSVTGLLRSRISSRRDRYGLDYVSGQQAVSTALASFGDLTGSGKTAVAVIEFLVNALPRRRFILSGELQPAGDSGAGVSLALRSEDTYDSLTALWAIPFEIQSDGTSPYQRMVIPAAAWSDYCLTRALGGRLLSRDPLSWAFFRAGLERQRLGEDDAARSLYEQALGHDGRNIGALANLGLIERRNQNYEIAEEHLNNALDEFET